DGGVNAERVPGPACEPAFRVDRSATPPTIRTGLAPSMLDIPSLLARPARSVESLLEAEVPRGRLPHISDGVWYQFSSGGKRLRPALCLITCEALQGDPRGAMPFALATEILHNYLLIHDDI